MTPVEINEAVARKLGWKVNKFPYKTGTPKKGGKWILGNDIPYYSTDIAAAWELLDKKLHNGGIAKNIHGRWVCSWDQGGGDWIVEVAEKAPLAICSAFLKTKS